MDFGVFGDFDDELFDATSKKANEDLNEQIKNYKAKNVEFDAFLTEQPNLDEPEDGSVLLKMQGDYYYLKKNYQKSLESYEESLKLANKSRDSGSKVYHDKKLIKDKEVMESIARCLARLDRFSEALEITDNFITMEQSSLNFEALSTNLNVKLDILITYRNLNNNNADLKYIDVEMITIEQLITLHPLLCQLWMKLGNSIYQKLKLSVESEAIKHDYLLVYLYVSQLTDHYFAFRGSIIQKQKEKQKEWLTEAELNLKTMHFDLSKLNRGVQNTVIIEKLEKADRYDDLERQAIAKSQVQHKSFSDVYFLDIPIYS